MFIRGYLQIENSILNVDRTSKSWPVVPLTYTSMYIFDRNKVLHFAR